MHHCVDPMYVYTHSYWLQRYEGSAMPYFSVSGLLSETTSLTQKTARQTTHKDAAIPATSPAPLMEKAATTVVNKTS